MSQADLLDEGTRRDGVFLVAVTGLSSGSPYRSDGLCAEQVDRLVELGGSWPAILIRPDGVVIDGAHRVAAARRLGLARIPAVHFVGSADDAFVEFVRRNVTQGLVLSLMERKAAATRVLDLHPDWSDRRIAELCALSPKTVGRLRGDDTEPREGRDHRVRPVRGSIRSRVVEALQAQPDASLRTIAAAVGVSPETVRLVRLNVDLDDVPPAVGDEPSEDEPVAEGWRSDAALASTAHGPELLRWLDRTDIDGAALEWAEAVPISRIYVVADEARRRSEAWLQLAKALEAQAGRGPARSHG